MNREKLILRLLQALIAVQLLVGVLSILTLSLGRAVATFGSAGLIYLGITIVQQLVGIRELLMYSSGQQTVQREVAPQSILSQLRKAKKETRQENQVPVRNPRQKQDAPATETNVYAVHNQSE